MKVKLSTILLLWLALACNRQPAVEPVASPVSVHLSLGNPTNARPDSVDSPNDFLMIKPQYALNYNKIVGPCQLGGLGVDQSRLRHLRPSGRFPSRPIPARRLVPGQNVRLHRFRFRPGPPLPLGRPHFHP